MIPVLSHYPPLHIINTQVRGTKGFIQFNHGIRIAVGVASVDPDGDPVHGDILREVDAGHGLLQGFQEFRHFQAEAFIQAEAGGSVTADGFVFEQELHAVEFQHHLVVPAGQDRIVKTDAYSCVAGRFRGKQSAGICNAVTEYTYIDREGCTDSGIAEGKEIFL